MSIRRRCAAEFIGTAWLVLGGCGAAVLAAAVPNLGIGYEGVAFAFGLTVLTGVYAFGPVSGGHFNPAVTVGLFVAGRVPRGDLLPYISSQVIGGIFGAAILACIASGLASFDIHAGFATNGYGEHSPQHYALHAGFVSEVVMTFMFLVIIFSVTTDNVPKGFAPIAIGLALTLIHLISIPVTNTSVNPARSTAVATWQGGWAWEQLWLFWVAPVIGAVLAGLAQRCWEMQTCWGTK